MGALKECVDGGLSQISVPGGVDTLKGFERSGISCLRWIDLNELDILEALGCGRWVGRGSCRCVGRSGDVCSDEDLYWHLNVTLTCQIHPTINCT